MHINSYNNKRIAKNTLFLYLRMLLSLGVSLYTARIILNALGIVDYGIYNVIGSIVSIFTFLNNSMISSSQRFITFEIGSGNQHLINKAYSTSINIHFIIAIIIFFLGEIFGLWYLKNQLVLPPSRLEAAFLIYQMSLLSTLIIIINVPFNALIIAYEKMKVFAWLTLIDVSFKLAIAFLIYMTDLDKLKVYAILILCVTLINHLIYRFYCLKTFKEIKYFFSNDSQLFKKMLSFAGWNLFGNLAVAAYTQGTNLILNSFFGPIINSARAIAIQVQGALFGFVSNFQIAINPQIIKSYANKDIQYMHNLIFNSSRISFYLLLLFSVPIGFCSHYLLNWWLVVVPEYTNSFLRLILVISLLETLVNPIVTAVQATGKIKSYQIIVGGLLLLILPFSYSLLKLGAPPESVFFVHISCALLAHTFRIILISKLIDLSIKQYLHSVVFVTLKATFISFILPIILYITLESSVTSFIIIFMSSFFSVCFSIYYFGISTAEQEMVNMVIKKLLIYSNIKKND